jgi:hypothetical protein
MTVIRLGEKTAEEARPVSAATPVKEPAADPASFQALNWPLNPGKGGGFASEKKEKTQKFAESTPKKAAPAAIPIEIRTFLIFSPIQKISYCASGPRIRNRPYVTFLLCGLT